LKSDSAIYRLCRNVATVEVLEEQANIYKLSPTICLSGSDLFTFLSSVIAKARSKYALVCHDDVILPETVSERIGIAVKRANSTYGSTNWGVIGNAGICWKDQAVTRFVADPHSTLIPPVQKSPEVAIFLDGNTLLLNIDNLRKKKVSLPPELGGFHLYDLVLVLESYRAGLLCCIDSNLYVKHLSQGKPIDFDSAKKAKDIQNYLKRCFVNHEFPTINGPVHTHPTYIHEFRRSRPADFFELVEKCVTKSISILDKITLNIGMRTTLKHIGKIRRCIDSVYMLSRMLPNSVHAKLIICINTPSPSCRRKLVPVNPQNRRKIRNILDEYENLDADVIYLRNSDLKGQYPRVAALRAISEKAQNNMSSYLWYIDDDDSIYPTKGNLFPILLSNESILIGNSDVFEETWSSDKELSTPLTSYFKERLSGKDYFRVLEGENHIPICSVIYPVNTLVKTFRDTELKGDYYEDYALFLASLKHSSPNYVNITIAAISRHGENAVLEKNRTHWDYSLVSFISEMIDRPLMSQINYSLINDFQGERQRLLDINTNEYAIPTNRKIWRVARRIVQLTDHIHRYLNKTLSQKRR